MTEQKSSNRFVLIAGALGAILIAYGIYAQWPAKKVVEPPATNTTDPR